MRILSLVALSFILCSCGSIHSYTYDFPDPLPENATIFLIQDSGPRDFSIRLISALRQEGFQVVGNNLIARQMQAPKLQINTADTIISTTNNFRQYEELFERGDFDYVLRYRANPNNSTSSSLGSLSLTLTETASGTVIGTYLHRGFIQGINVPTFLEQLAKAIREGKVDSYLNPRLSK
ncbi:MAG: hypothetical protein AAF433_03245 [Bacteroidota bacterium]